jgi:hypothetical protein
MNSLRALIIQAWHGETYHDNQNVAENRYNTLKAATANRRLLALAYVYLLSNHLASRALGWIPPNQSRTGQIQDISMFLNLPCYEAV